MTIATNARTKIYIGAAIDSNATLDDFEDQVWTEIKNVVDIGEWGPQANILTRVHIGDSHVGRRKGAIDSGEVALVVSRDPADLGQTKLRTAAASQDLPIAFKVVPADRPTPTGTDTNFYFGAVVGGARNKFGEADNIIDTTFTLGIDGKILEVPAAEAVGP